MTEVLELAVALLAGGLLGSLFFWGLWRTLDGLHRARRPALRVLVSLLLRVGLLAVAFYGLARYASWQHAIAAVLGFTLARLWLVRALAPRGPDAEPDA